jgi:IstB-like ATP binding protein
MIATTAAQSVAGLFLAGFLLILAVSELDRGVGDAVRRWTRWRPSPLLAFGLASLSVNLGWIVITDWGLTWSYLLPKWSTLEDALSAIVHFGSHRDPFQQSGLPIYEQYAGYAALVLTVAALTAALVLHLRGRLRPDPSSKERAAIRASFFLGAQFVVSMPFALSGESAIWVHRAQELEWMRYEKSSSIVITSNRGFSDWSQVFADQVVATAIVDRLIDNAIVINIRGHSYRMRAHQDSTNGKNGR